MHQAARAIPFSAKKKKAQLQDKRQRKRDKVAVSNTPVSDTCGVCKDTLLNRVDRDDTYNEEQKEREREPDRSTDYSDGRNSEGHPLQQSRQDSHGCIPTQTAGTVSHPPVSAHSSIYCCRVTSRQEHLQKESSESIQESKEIESVDARSAAHCHSPARNSSGRNASHVHQEQTRTKITPCISSTDSRSKASHFESVFAKVELDAIQAMRLASQSPITPLPQTVLEIGFEDLYPSGDMIDFPKRPHWNHSDSKETLEKRESEYFKWWLDGVNRRFDPDSLGYFEQNLEVWRQLWRVVEVSDIILFIVDSRHPILHFPPTLYNYIVVEMKRTLILVFNKIDLVPAPILAAWKEYFQNRYSGIHIVEFSCYSRDVFNVQDSMQGTLIKGKQPKSKRYAHAVGALQIIEECSKVKFDKNGIEINWAELMDQMQKDINKREKQASDVIERKECTESFLGRSRRRQQVPKSVSITCIQDTDIENDASKSKESFQLDLGQENQSISESITSRADLITIGLVGHPNVGKSSLINGIMGRTVVPTSKTPGHTKHFQTLHLSKRIRLCDCPGIVFPLKISKPAQILAGMYRIAQVREPCSVISYLAERIPIPDILHLKPPAYATFDKSINKTLAQSQATFLWSGWTICEAFAIQRGFLTSKTARPDVHRAASMLLGMVNYGKLLLVYRPSNFSSMHINLDFQNWQKLHHTSVSNASGSKGTRNGDLSKANDAQSLIECIHETQDEASPCTQSIAHLNSFAFLTDTTE